MEYGQQFLTYNLTGNKRNCSTVGLHATDLSFSWSYLFQK